MPLNLGRVRVRRQGKRVESIVDARGAEGRALLVAGRLVELREIERAAGFLGGRLCACALRRGALRGFFGCELGVAFGLFARCFGFLCFGCFPVVKKRVC